MSEEEPLPEDDPFEQLIRSEPPSTLAEAGERAMAYMAGLEEITKVHANDPLQAAEDTLCLTMRLSASLSPAGSPGPAHVVFAPLLETVMQMKMGVQPSLMRHGPQPDPASHPSAPHVILGRALAAAVMSLLNHGVRRKDAMRKVAQRLQRAGVKFQRRNADPPGAVAYWHKQAKNPRGQEPLHLAYQEHNQQLAFRQSQVRPEARQELLLRALDKGVALGLFNTPPDTE